ncbi:Conserved_hypothetical protein [Hexamita inflata]|uniref:Uncharacterized protein n=1 Tax=Hexamita inflata TaxID=28002 RepID=A0AA86UPL5_9EUKA|nr:Conserved hypothetical protein [Hexamita inflata]
MFKGKGLFAKLKNTFAPSAEIDQLLTRNEQILAELNVDIIDETPLISEYSNNMLDILQSNLNIKETPQSFLQYVCKNTDFQSYLDDVDYQLQFQLNNDYSDDQQKLIVEIFFRKLLVYKCTTIFLELIINLGEKIKNTFYEENCVFMQQNYVDLLFNMYQSIEQEEKTINFTYDIRFFKQLQQDEYDQLIKIQTHIKALPIKIISYKPESKDVQADIFEIFQDLQTIQLIQLLEQTQELIYQIQEGNSYFSDALYSMMNMSVDDPEYEDIHQYIDNILQLYADIGMKIKSKKSQFRSPQTQGETQMKLIFIRYMIANPLLLTLLLAYLGGNLEQNKPQGHLFVIKQIKDPNSFINNPICCTQLSKVIRDYLSEKQFLNVNYLGCYYYAYFSQLMGLIFSTEIAHLLQFGLLENIVQIMEAKVAEKQDIELLQFFFVVVAMEILESANGRFYQWFRKSGISSRDSVLQNIQLGPEETEDEFGMRIVFTLLKEKQMHTLFDGDFKAVWIVQQFEQLSNVPESYNSSQYIQKQKLLYIQVIYTLYNNALQKGCAQIDDEIQKQLHAQIIVQLAQESMQLISQIEGQKRYILELVEMSNVSDCDEKLQPHILNILNLQQKPSNQILELKNTLKCNNSSQFEHKLSKILIFNFLGEDLIYILKQFLDSIIPTTKKNQDRTPVEFLTLYKIMQNQNDSVAEFCNQIYTQNGFKDLILMLIKYNVYFRKLYKFNTELLNISVLKSILDEIENISQNNVQSPEVLTEIPKEVPKELPQKSNAQAKTVIKEETSKQETQKEPQNVPLIEPTPTKPVQNDLPPIQPSVFADIQSQPIGGLNNQATDLFGQITSTMDLNINLFDLGSMGSLAGIGVNAYTSTAIGNLDLDSFLQSEEPQVNDPQIQEPQTIAEPEKKTGYFVRDYVDDDEEEEKRNELKRIEQEKEEIERKRKQKIEEEEEQKRIEEQRVIDEQKRIEREKAEKIQQQQEEEQRKLRDLKRQQYEEEQKKKLLDIQMKKQQEALEKQRKQQEEDEEVQKQLENERLKVIQKENERKQAEEEKQRLRQEAEEIKKREEEEKRRIQEAEEAKILEQQKEAMRLYQQEIEEQKKKVEQQQLLNQQTALENNIHEHTICIQQTNISDILVTDIQLNTLEQQNLKELNNIKLIEEQKKIEEQQRILQEQNIQSQQALEKQRKLEDVKQQQLLDIEKLQIIRKQQQDNDKIKVKEANIIVNQNLTVQHQLKDKTISPDQIILSQIEMQISNQESKQFEYIKYYYNQEQNQVNIPKYNFKQYQINDLKIDINELLSLKYVYDVLEYNNSHLNKNILQINQNNQIDIQQIQTLLTEEEININQLQFQCIKCNQLCDISITQNQIAPFCYTCESKQISYIQLQTLFSAEVRNIQEFQDIFEIDAIAEIKRVINLYVKSDKIASSFISIHDILSEMTQSQLTPSSNVYQFTQYLQSQDHKFKLNIPLQLSSFKGAQGFYSLILLEILAQRSSIHNQCSICMFNIQILQYDKETLVKMIKERIFGWKICVKCLRFAHHVCQNGELCNDCK